MCATQERACAYPAAIPAAVATLATLALLGCEPRQVEPPYAPLPVAYADSTIILDCAGPRSRISVGQWVHSGEAFAFGVVHSARVLRDSSQGICTVNGELPLYVDDDCPGRVDGGLQIDLLDVRALTGDAPSQLTVTIGVTHAETWAPSLIVRGTPEGSELPPEWFPGDQPGRVFPGQVVGGALWYDDSAEKWGPLDTPLFQLLNGRVEVQQFGNDSCPFYYPEPTNDLTLTDLEAAATEAPSVEEEAAIAERRAAVLSPSPEERLRWWWSSHCWTRCD